MISISQNLCMTRSNSIRTDGRQIGGKRYDLKAGTPILQTLKHDLVLI